MDAPTPRPDAPEPAGDRDEPVTPPAVRPAGGPAPHPLLDPDLVETRPSNREIEIELSPEPDTSFPDAEPHPDADEPTDDPDTQHGDRRPVSAVASPGGDAGDADSEPIPVDDPDDTLPVTRAPAERRVATMDQPSETNGNALAGRFRLGMELGHGGTAVVYEARDRRLDRELAIKFLHDTADASLRRAFIREARVTGQLEHPNIVPVHELGYERDLPFIALKRVHGRTLSRVIDDFHARTPAAERWTVRRLLEVFLKVCDGVSFAHSRGWLHRDLKPGNVMIGDFGEVLIVDWGIARRIDHPVAHTHPPPVATADRDSLSAAGRRTGEPDTSGTDTDEKHPRRLDVTIDGTVIGTPGFMPPEQAAGRVSQLDERADIFALGATLYTILTNHVPFHGAGASIHDVLAATREYELVPPSRRRGRSRVPHELEAIVLKAMARRASDRYPSVVALQADVERYLDDRMVAAATYTPLRRLAKWSSQHRSFLAGTAATLMAALAGTVGILGVERSRLAERDARISAQAEADRVTADIAHRRAEAARLQREAAVAEAERVAAEQQADEAELARLVATGRLDELLERLIGQTVRDRNERLQAFHRQLEAGRRAGVADELVIERMPKHDLDSYIEVLEIRLEQHEAFGDRFPVEPKDRYYLSLMLVNGRHDVDAGLRIARDLTHDHPDYLHGWTALGLVYSKLERYPEAIIAFTRGLELAPETPELLANRGIARFRAGRWQPAIDDLQAAVARRPTMVGAWLFLARAFGILRDHDRARHAIEQATRLAPDNVEVLIAHTMIRLDSGDIVGAEPLIERVLAVEPDHAQAIALRGAIRADLGRHTEAVPDLEFAVLRVYSRSAYWWTRLGTVYVRVDRIDDAIDACRKALELDPLYAEAWYRLGAAEFLLRLHEQSVEHLRRAVELRPDVFEYAKSYGLCLHDVQQHEEAIRWLNTALDQRPDDWDMLLARGDSYRLLGDHDRARADLDRALELAPDDEGRAKVQTVRTLLGD